MIVNTDADNQYDGRDIPKLVEPILAGDADMVVGDRQVMTIEHFSPAKKALQRLGSWVVRQASQTDVPDTTSGFRAYNREAALALQVVSKFTYTLETIIQAGKMRVAIDHVPVRTNPKLRESRLFPSMWTYIRRNGISIFRIYAMYEPLKVFMTAAILVGLAAFAVWARFLYFWIDGDGAGHVQSLILGAVLFNAAMVLAALGVLGDLISGQRITLQRIFERVRRIELELGVPPSHYEPGAPGQRPGARRPARSAGGHGDDRGARGGEAVSGRRVTRDAEGTVTGNTYDKYGSTNPVVRRLMATFQRTLGELFESVDPGSVLDVGCGEAILTHQWATARPATRVVGFDLEDPRAPGASGSSARARTSSTASCARRSRSRSPRASSRSPRRSRCSSTCPIPEHTRRRDGALRARRPRARLGAARAAVARAEPGARRLRADLGNTPGHVNHWSKRGFVALLSRHGEVVEARSPFPWTMLLVRV